MRASRSWTSLPLSTESEEAESCYRRGIAALVAGLADAEELLDEAITLDPRFFVAHVGLAAARAVAGEPYTPPARTVEIRRGERQHAEIVEAEFSGQHARAVALRGEHLHEYPGDLLIVWLPALRAQRPALG